MNRSVKKETQMFCENISAIRKKLRLSKKEMAKILGIGIGSLSKIENGVIPPKMSCKVLFKINKNFNIKYVDIFKENSIGKYFQE